MINGVVVDGVGVPGYDCRVGLSIFEDLLSCSFWIQVGSEDEERHLTCETFIEPDELFRVLTLESKGMNVSSFGDDIDSQFDLFTNGIWLTTSISRFEFRCEHPDSRSFRLSLNATIPEDWGIGCKAIVANCQVKQLCLSPLLAGRIDYLERLQSVYPELSEWLACDVPQEIFYISL